MQTFRFLYALGWSSQLDAKSGRSKGDPEYSAGLYLICSLFGLIHGLLSTAAWIAGLTGELSAEIWHERSAGTIAALALTFVVMWFAFRRRIASIQSEFDWLRPPKSVFGRIVSITIAFLVGGLLTYLGYQDQKTFLLGSTAILIFCEIAVSAAAHRAKAALTRRERG